MSGSRRGALLGWLLPTLLLLVGAGCDRSSEAEYGRAIGRVESSERAVARAQVALERSEREARQAEEQAERDRQSVIRAKEVLAKAEGRLGTVATDQVLFRTIQRRLLDAKALRDTAILVRVQGGRVILTGSVPDRALRALAEETVTGTRGVQTVDNQIELEPAAANG